MPYKKKTARIASRKRYYRKLMADPVRGPKARDQRRLATKKWKEADWRRSLLISARERAKRDGVRCTITLDDIEIPQFCPVFPYLRLGRSSGAAKDNSPTLDRIRPLLGYVRGNVAVISHKANRVKNSATIDELQAAIDYMVRYTP